MTKEKIKKISVVGLGYIGLPTAAMFASRKVHVVGVDVNQLAVDKINQGEIHIMEPDLEAVVQAAVREGFFRATTRTETAEVFLIAVPTPFKGSDNEPDLSYIQAATKAIAPVLEPGNLVILESTSPVGTTEAMAEWLAHERPDLTFPLGAGEASDIRIAYCPERVIPGKIMQELITNDRIIGGMTLRCSTMASELYKTFVRGECVIASNPRVAEMAKLTENSFRDVNIAFANELSLISDKIEIDVWELISLSNRHPRVNILQPGPGVGGHCIAVDPWFIISKTPDLSRLITTARHVNDYKPSWVIKKIKESIEELSNSSFYESPNSIKIAIYGLAFKADVDDLRESPALSIAKRMIGFHRGTVWCVEPNIEKAPDDSIKLCSINHAMENADIHVLLVDHKEFKEIHDTPDGIVIDTKGIWR